jgi:hypothetical protein
LTTTAGSPRGEACARVQAELDEGPRPQNASTD